ncbi:MAG: hypothetical protein IT331_08900 [Anaerolineae bacterium]|nr:hypothetical protein [Anaerolineae bacterium]
MSIQFLARCGAAAAFAASFLLAWQFVIGLGIGEEIALLSSSVESTRLRTFFEMHEVALRRLMTVDDAFAIAYAVAFVALGVYLLPRARVIVGIAMGLTLATAFLDLGENSLTLAAVELVNQNQTLEQKMVTTLFWLGQMKFLTIYVGGILFALPLWQEGRMGKALAALLGLFALIGVAAISIPTLDLVKVLWMFVLLVAGGVFMARARTE